MSRTIGSAISLLSCIAALGCGRDSPSAFAVPEVTIASASAHYGDWSAPQPFPAGINTAATEQTAALSRDGLALYFASLRPGGFGDSDIYVSTRASLDDAWEAPVNLGPLVNTAGTEHGPKLSIDERLLFFTSSRAGGQGGTDIYVARREDMRDAAAWVNVKALGTDVNTADFEAGAVYLQTADGGTANLYFNRGFLPAFAGDIYRAAITRDGETLGPAEPVAELNRAGINDAGVSIRRDGRELFFWSPRPGGIGGQDIWTSTRRSLAEPWSPPTNLGPPVNSAGHDQSPTLSFDGLTLLITALRPGSATFDLYYSTRTRTDHP